jgi:hypothetical protein
MKQTMSRKSEVLPELFSLISEEENEGSCFTMVLLCTREVLVESVSLNVSLGSRFSHKTLPTRIKSHTLNNKAYGPLSLSEA